MKINVNPIHVFSINCRPVIKHNFSTVSNTRKSMSILINRISNKSILDGGKSVYQVTVKTDHARHPRLPLPLPLPPRYFIHWITSVQRRTRCVFLGNGNPPPSHLARREGGGQRGGGGGSDNLYRTAPPRWA